MSGITVKFWLLVGVFLATLRFQVFAAAVSSNVCTLRPLGAGEDDTDQVLAAIDSCGQYGTTIFEAGEYNITRKMTWNLVSSRVEMHGYLSFQPDIQYWLNANNTYRVVYIQDQASWFVVTGTDFEIDAFNSGGINGNGQPWWDYYTTVPRLDGDGRPLALTLYNVTAGRVTNFRIESPPFWCNAVAESKNVVYDGMVCNATNTNPEFYGQISSRTLMAEGFVLTIGIDTYRSDSVTLINWDVTTGDDCLAIKGNTTNLYVANITCRGGNGVAFGSLGQYVDLPDIVENVFMEDMNMVRLASYIQPNMGSGVYFKSWSATVNGTPPTGGGGGLGYVKNVVVQNVKVDNVTTPISLYQTDGAEAGDAPSKYQFEDLTFSGFTGTAQENTIVSIACSSAAPCPNITFSDIDVAPPSGEAPMYICQNVINESGLPDVGNNYERSGYQFKRAMREREKKSNDGLRKEEKVGRGIDDIRRVGSTAKGHS
ncbi:glycoside hydrolase family 28 protein [Serpula lacrymans var. lacrymans S7.9]|uniref:galacturonan 1,4-alpha-galacturonidase n=1 Tax=Serpula lacrymans var. lacrymans (strain S7.9) TaxID=578457 RepID=F8NRU3_SERL9|nr:glycoside hydrolase family 28 protein [Serpula lacrymans var. lacrymans S7.9]EGO26829.1 glycoside hydrolase family 28 protein [Serpula lacrymans var. lacrymans S7.9]